METTSPNADNMAWKRWCRLCAKEDCENNLCIFPEVETTNAIDSSLATAIGKFFWVNIRPNDELSKFVCLDCHTLVSSLMHFTERVNKVQAMFCALQNSSLANALDLNEIKTQYGLLDMEWEHVIKHERKTKDTETNEECVDWELEVENNKDTDILELEVDGDDSKPVEEYAIEFVRRGTKMKLDECTEEEDDNNVISLRKLVEGSEEEGEEEEHFVFEKPNEEELNDAELLRQLMGEEEDDNDNGEVEKRRKEETLNKNDNDKSENYEEIILHEEILELDEASDENTNKGGEETAQVNKIDSSSRVRKKRGRPFKYGTLDNAEQNNKGEIESDDDENNVALYKYECTVCHKKYKNPTSYRKHTMEKHDKEPDIPDFRCETCDKVLPTERQLEIHARTHLALEDKLDIPCPYCERKFTKTSVMRQHVRGIHENRKPYICDVCGRRSKTMAALAEHKLVHTNDTPYECEVCQRAFKNKARLKVHLETHNDSSFICTECGLKLNTRRTLKMHMLVHSDAKRYKCDFCPAAFKRTKALKNHLILHTGMRPYKCQFCGKTFSNGSNCRSHKKKMHAQELAEEEAMGKKAEVVTVPKLEELRSSTNVVGNPRKVQRHHGGLPLHMRQLLIAAEERFKREKQNEMLVGANDGTEICGEETQSRSAESPTMEFEVDEETKNIQLQQAILDDGEDDDNEMVVYEIIAEI